MTVYSRKVGGGVVWRYDFERGGRRFTSPSSYPSKPKANRAERDAIKAAELGGAPVRPRKDASAKRARAASGQVAPEEVTLAIACDTYWNDKAKHHRSAADIERRLDHCKRLIGEATLLADIRFATVNAAVQERRRETTRFGKPLTAGGVNRDIVDALRPAINHAADEFELTLPRIAWRKLRLKEAGEIVCEFTDAEVEGWGGQLTCDAERLYLALALTYGQRRGENYFPLAAIKRGDDGPFVEIGCWLNREGVWRQSRKDGSLHEVALTEADAALLEAQRDRAEAVGAPHLWVDEAGRLISYYAMGHRLRTAAERAGIVKERLLHGMRHHAGTMIARKNGGSLHLAMQLLGHRKITTTQRYAHVSKTDTRAAITRTKASARVPPQSHQGGPGL